jgi:hypothetical protein
MPFLYAFFGWSARRGHSNASVAMSLAVDQAVPICGGLLAGVGFGAAASELRGRRPRSSASMAFRRRRRARWFGSRRSSLELQRLEPIARSSALEVQGSSRSLASGAHRPEPIVRSPSSGVQRPEFSVRSVRSSASWVQRCDARRSSARDPTLATQRLRLSVVLRVE